MTVSYQVTCSALVGGQSLVIGSSTNGGVSGTSWSETVVLPSAPTPTIKLGGNTISGTQSVVVGQQIALSGSASLPPCTSISAKQWSTPPGTAVGGYSASSTSDSVTTLPTNTNSTYTFYWVAAQNSANMTYQYTMSGGGGSVATPVATATFNITAATVSSMGTPTGYVGIFQGPVLGYGPTGITFSPTVTTPSGDSGQFEWVQLITNDTLTLTETNGTTLTCVVATQPANPSGTGLDSGYPYATGTSTVDSPDVPLLSSVYTNEARSFSASMYLLWNPLLPVGCTGGSCTSIPVPLGSVAWGWSGAASYSASNWSLTASSTTAPSWVSGTSYPIWSDYLPYDLVILSTRSGLSCH